MRPLITMSDGSDRRRKRFAVAAVSIYALFLVAAVAAYLSLRDSESMSMVLYFISSALSLVTILLAVFITRSSPSEEYYERYLREEEKQEEGRRNRDITCRLSPRSSPLSR